MKPMFQRTETALHKPHRKSDKTVLKTPQPGPARDLTGPVGWKRDYADMVALKGLSPRVDQTPVYCEVSQRDATPSNKLLTTDTDQVTIHDQLLGPSTTLRSCPLQ